MSNLKILHLISPVTDLSKIYPDALLLTSCQENLLPGIYYTSLHDLRPEEIIRISIQFDEIKLGTNGFSQLQDLYHSTVELYNFISVYSKKKNKLEFNQFTDSEEIKTREDLPTLWVFGCSHSAGVGLKDHESSYGQIISKNLKIPLKLIAKGGSSLSWAHRHLFNCPIQSRDIVLWQITSAARLSVCHDNRVSEIMMNTTKNRSILDFMTDEQMYFTHFSLINTGYRFLERIGCTFLMTSAIPFNYENSSYLAEYNKYSKYLGNWDFVDYGTDGRHGGQLTHFTIAHRILDKLQYIDV